MRVVYKTSNSCFITYWLCHPNNFNNYLKLTLLFLILASLFNRNSGIYSFQVNFIFSVVLSSVFHVFFPLYSDSTA